MRHFSRLFLCLGAPVALLLTSCGTMMTSTASSRNYKVVAYKPHDPSKVEVNLSLSTQNLYVTEGDRLLMAVQGNVGKPDAPTPTGDFTIYNKEKHRRRASEPDRGYPMAYWCEFKSAYGFHEGFVHPAPHTHGCVRLHREAAARLFALVRIGTRVHIANSLPEDKKWGSKVARLDQSKDPDPPRSFMLSDAWFKDPPGPLLVDQKE
ncbi:MAG: L,D-transpeptidase [Chthoniobacterales bacterium]